MNAEITSLPSDWLDAATVNYVRAGVNTVALETTATSSITTTGAWCWPYDNNTYYYHWWPHWTEIKKIRLTMSDVEKLRRAAKKDDAIKKVLQKIGPHIEVEVDFE